MRILWGSNSPWNGSGYGVQTALITPRLQAAGHDMAIASNYGVQGWCAGYEGMRVYPEGGEPHSVAILADHADHHQADAVITHYDAWVYDPRNMRRPWAPWFPIDTDEVSPLVLDRVRQAAFAVTQTRHGQESCGRAGLKVGYVPASFDGSVYRPVDGSAWRAQVGLKDSTHLCMMVAANKGAPGAPSRKSFAQVFEGFRLFLDQHDDAVLYCHSLMHGHLNLAEMAERAGIGEHLHFAHPYPLFSGLVGAEDMAGIYSAADVLLSPSMGEGFGVPIVEAQACGTPVITGDWTAMSEITRSGVKIPKSEAIRHPVAHGDGFYGDMFIVRPEAVRDALVESLDWKYAPAEVSAAVAEYEVDHVFAEHWLPTLERLEKTARKPQPHPSGLNRAQRRAQIKGKVAAA